MKRQKNEDFDDCSQLKTRSKRIGRRKNVIFKTKLLVPEMTVKEKKRAPLPRRLTYLLSAG
jgi:hypothetical protein